MLSLKVAELDLADGVSLLAMDYRVSRNVEFTDIIYEKSYDADNLTSLLIDVRLEPGVKYYANARAALSTGYTRWGNIEEFYPRDVVDIDVKLDVPSVISIPIITTDSDHSTHAKTLFTITATGFSVIGDSALDSVTWIIEDIDQKVVWSSIRNKYDTESITITDMILEPSRLYRIRVIFYNTANDHSVISTKTIITSPDNRLVITSPIDNIDTTVDLTVGLRSILGPTVTSWKLYDLTLGGVLIWERELATGDIFNLDIPHVVLTDKSMYILDISTDDAAGSNNWFFSTY